MPLPNERTYTIDDIYALPEGKRAELIDGVIYDMAPPNRLHQRVSGQLYKSIANYIDSKGGSCEIYSAPFAVFLNEDNKNYIEPDISVICDKSKLSDRGCEGAPDLIIEIVSPSSKRMDYYIKNALYAKSGVREYWIVDPSKERTMICNFEQDEAPMIVPFSQPTQSGIFNQLEIIINDLLK